MKITSVRVSVTRNCKTFHLGSVDLPELNHVSFFFFCFFNFAPFPYETKKVWKLPHLFADPLSSIQAVVSTNWTLDKTTI